jgi:hypothetical protein
MSEPQKMYRAYSTENIATYGLGYWVGTGEIVNVNGTDMVRDGGLIMEISDRWHPSLEQALAKLAERCQLLADRFAAQAAALREGRDVSTVA